MPVCEFMWTVHRCVCVGVSPWCLYRCVHVGMSWWCLHRCVCVGLSWWCVHRYICLGVSQWCVHRCFVGMSQWCVHGCVVCAQVCLCGCVTVVFDQQRTGYASLSSRTLTQIYRNIAGAKIPSIHSSIHLSIHSLFSLMWDICFKSFECGICVPMLRSISLLLTKCSWSSLPVFWSPASVMFPENSVSLCNRPVSVGMGPEPIRVFTHDQATLHSSILAVGPSSGYCGGWGLVGYSVTSEPLLDFVDLP